jgi:hypothetical protein
MVRGEPCFICGMPGHNVWKVKPEDVLAAHRLCDDLNQGCESELNQGVQR